MSTHASIAELLQVIPPRSRLPQGYFGRLFPDLPAWAPPFRQGPSPSDQVADAFFKGIARNKMMENVGQNLDSNIPAGYTYFGQFIDHDITFDPVSSLVRQNDPNMLHNFRTPRLDLDNVYLSGPQASPHLYEKSQFGRFLLWKGVNPNEPDLPRNQDGTALIGDPRNDENVIVSQLQLAFLKFHNRVFDAKLIELKGNAQAAFDEARRILTWTYQYVVWNDFLKRVLDNTVRSSVLTLQPKAGLTRWQLGTQFYNWTNTPFMPVEFSVAAYRFGHSLVRNGYRLNIKTGPNINQEIPIFSTTTSDLRGGSPLKLNHTLEWDWFLELPSSIGGFPQRTRQIDPLLSRSLADIPPGSQNALAFLNLKRSWRMGLPSGPDVARYMGVKPIRTAKDEEALWFYILKEAQGNGGNQLGIVGSTIVGEVFAGLLHGDPNSYLNVDPLWTPSREPFLKDKGPFRKNPADPSTFDQWELGDMIRIAQMPEDAGQVTDLIDTGTFTPTV